MSDDREHWCYADENGEFDECLEDCPGCHWEGNTDCEAIRAGCDICDPDGVLYAAAARPTPVPPSSTGRPR